MAKGKVEYEKEATVNVICAVEMPLQECLPVKSWKAVKCCCGEVCKGSHGLKMHQRGYRVIGDLENEELTNHQMGSIVDQINPDISALNTQENFSDLKKGIKLGFWKLSESSMPINPIHWFRFADDSTVISGQEKENQTL